MSKQVNSPRLNLVTKSPKLKGTPNIQLVGVPKVNEIPKVQPVGVPINPDENKYNNFSNTQTSGPLADDYKNYEELRQYIYDKPDIYIGSETTSTNYKFLLDLEKLVFTEKEITYCEGVERLFLEGLSNASDNAEKSRRYRCNPGKIIVEMTPTVIRIKNGGVVIPVEKRSDGLWVPYVIFGKLMSSSNYDKNVTRLGVGKFGVGIKLANIFSKFFKITICDGVRKLKYTQIWRNNMIICEPETIVPYTGENSVEVEYHMDFERFEMKEYTPEYFQMYSAHCVDFSWTCKIPIIFNGVTLNYQNLKNYVTLYYPENHNLIFHYEWPEKIAVMNNENKLIWVDVQFEEKAGKRIPKDKSVVPIAELCIIDSPDSSSYISFANGMRTPQNGCHVDGALKNLTDIVLGYFNGDKKTADKKIKLTPGDVKSHISMILSVRVSDPGYESQSKKMLKTPKPKFDIPEKIIKPMENWKLFDRLYLALELKELKEMKKTDGKKSKHVNVPKLIDCKEAGGKYSSTCTLFLTEGDSALGYFLNLVTLLPGGRDRNGGFPLRGKTLNVMNATARQIAENNEVVCIKKIMGLREDIDYTIPANRNSLRYGNICILADSDSDGYSIAGLILCFIYSRFPTLIKSGAINYMKTPILRINKGKQKMKFYTISAFRKWENATPNSSSWNVVYYKGLSSSSKTDIYDDSKTNQIVNFVQDEKTSENMRLAFDKKLANQRKIWLAEYFPKDEIENITIQNISEFINTRFIEFSLENLHRSLPKLLDGLKTSLRKILWTCYLEWKFKPDSKEMKVADLASVTSTRTNYHHGPVSLMEACIGLAQNIVGLNNLPYLIDDGGFGSRFKNGKDAGSPRYLKTKTSWWVQYVFKNEDIPLLKLINDENTECEPETFYPIFPTALLNPQVGIGTGSSTNVPAFNPLDLTGWIKAKVKGLKLPTLVPWYNKFTGKIEVVSPTKGIPVLNLVNNVEDIVTEQDENEEEKKEEVLTVENVRVELEKEEKEEKIARISKHSMITYGIFTVKGDVIDVIELPIGMYPEKYKMFLEVLMEDGKITKYEENCNEFEGTVHFKIYGFKDPTYDKLKLMKTMALTNMVFLDLENRPRRYNNFQVIMEEWYVLRLPIYEKRRLHKLAELNAQMETYKHKIKFYELVISGKIDIRSKSSEILAIITTMGIPDKIYLDTKLPSISEDKIKKFKDEVAECQKEIDYYTQIKATDLWLKDLEIFEVEYKKRFKK